MRVTGDIVKSVWAGVAVRYGTRVVTKKSAAEMQIVGAVLERIGVQDSDMFMSRFTTTIDHSIFVPFEVGVGSEDALFAQLVTCAHEHQHVAQSERDEWFAARYLCDPVARATYEAEAYRSAMEMHAWAGLPVPSPASLAEKLRHYACGDAEVEHAQKYLAMSEPGIRLGMITNEATRSTVLEMERCGLRRGFKADK